MLPAYLKHRIDWTVSPTHVDVWMDNHAAVKAVKKHIRANGTIYAGMWRRLPNPAFINYHKRRFCFEASRPARIAIRLKQIR